VGRDIVWGVVGGPTPGSSSPKPPAGATSLVRVVGGPTPGVGGPTPKISPYYMTDTSTPTDPIVGIDDATAQRTRTVFNFCSGGRSAIFHSIGCLYGTYLADKTVPSCPECTVDRCVCKRRLTECKTNRLRDDFSMFSTSGGAFVTLVLHILYANEIPLTDDTWRYFIVEFFNKFNVRVLLQLYTMMIVTTAYNVYLRNFTGNIDSVDANVCYDSAIEIIRDMVNEVFDSYETTVLDGKKLVWKKPVFGESSQFIYNYHRMDADIPKAGETDDFDFLNDPSYDLYQAMYCVMRSSVIFTAHKDNFDPLPPHNNSFNMDSGAFGALWNNQFSKYDFTKLETIVVNTMSPVEDEFDDILTRLNSTPIYTGFDLLLNGGIYALAQQFNDTQYIKNIQTEIDKTPGSPTTLHYISTRGGRSPITPQLGNIGTNIPMGGDASPPFTDIYNSEYPLQSTISDPSRFLALKGNNDRYPVILLLYAAIQTYAGIQGVDANVAEKIVFDSLTVAVPDPGNIFNAPFPSVITPEILTENDLLWQINQLIDGVRPGIVTDIMGESSVIERAFRCFTG